MIGEPSYSWESSYFAYCQRMMNLAHVIYFYPAVTVEKNNLSGAFSALLHNLCALVFSQLCLAFLMKTLKKVIDIYMYLENAHIDFVKFHS